MASLHLYKEEEIELGCNKGVFFDPRQNSATKVIKFCHYHHWEALKICATTNNLE